MLRARIVAVALLLVLAPGCAAFSGLWPGDTRPQVPARGTLAPTGVPAEALALPEESVGEPDSVWAVPHVYGEIELPAAEGSAEAALPMAALSVAELGYSARVHFIDVGQGDATLFEFPCGAVLVDGGAERNAEFDGVAALEEYLDWFFDVERTDLDFTLDLLVISHPHTDHTKGIPSVLASYTVENAVTDGLNERNRRGAQRTLHADATESDIVLRKVSRTGAVQTNGVIDPVRCNDVDPEISILWGGAVPRPSGWANSDFNNPNNHSVVVRVVVDGVSFLLTGDLEDRAIETLLSDFSDGSELDVDVYQVGHHGSANATTQDLVDAMTPQIAIISTGSHAREIRRMSAFEHGHPRKDVVEILDDNVSLARDRKRVHVATAQRTFERKSIDGAVFATAWDGSIVVEVSNGAFAVETER